MKVAYPWIDIVCYAEWNELERGINIGVSLICDIKEK